MNENFGPRAYDDSGPTLHGLRLATVEGYLDLPLPIPADDEAAAVVERFARASNASREALRTHLSSPEYDALLAFAIRMAMLAVRERSIARLRLGLRAVALAGDAPPADWRETSLPLLLLRDAAWRIDADARGEFANAARLAQGRTVRALTGAVPRSTLMVGIERLVMRLGVGMWKAVNAPDGFRYVPTRRVSREEVDDLIRRAEQARRTHATDENSRATKRP